LAQRDGFFSYVLVSRGSDMSCTNGILERGSSAYAIGSVSGGELCPNCGNKYMPDALYCRNCGQKRAEQAVYIQSEPAAQIGSWQRYGSASLGNYAGAPAAQAASESARDVQRYVTGGSVAHVGSSGPQLPAYTVDAALAQTSPTAVAGTYTTGGSAGSYTPRTAQMHSGSYSPYSNAGAAQLPATHYVAGGYAGSYANGSAVQGAPVGLYTGNAAHLLQEHTRLNMAMLG